MNVKVFKTNKKSTKFEQNVRKDKFLHKKSKQLFGCNYKMIYLCSDFQTECK